MDTRAQDEAEEVMRRARKLYPQYKWERRRKTVPIVADECELVDELAVLSKNGQYRAVWPVFFWADNPYLVFHAITVMRNLRNRNGRVMPTSEYDH